MQTVTLKSQELDTLISFIMEVGKNPQRVGKSFPELSWRAMNKLDGVVSDLEAIAKPKREDFAKLNQDFEAKVGELRSQLASAQGEDLKALQSQLAEEIKKFREENSVEAKEKEELTVELAEEKHEMIKKMLDDHAMELFVRREPLDVLLPAFGLKE